MLQMHILLKNRYVFVLHLFNSKFIVVTFSEQWKSINKEHSEFTIPETENRQRYPDGSSPAWKIKSLPWKYCNARKITFSSLTSKRKDGYFSGKVFYFISLHSSQFILEAYSKLEDGKKSSERSMQTSPHAKEPFSLNLLTFVCVCVLI